MTAAQREATVSGEPDPAHAGRRRLRHPEPYRYLVGAVAAQLQAQRVGLPPPMLAVLPVVGFGEQAADVITATLDLLATSTASGVLLVLVNRPQRQPPDGTLARVQGWRQLHPDAAVVVADVALAFRPRIGELRQLGVDAAEQAWGTSPAGGSVMFVDDDVVAFPAQTTSALQHRLQGAPLAIGPVLFDHPEMPMCLVPELYTGDLFRALLVDLVLQRVEQEPLDAAWATVESLVLSGNLAVRRDALAQVGGLHDLNELTELTRDVLQGSACEAFAPPARSVAVFDSGEEPLGRLRRLAVRMHSRRALAAYQTAGLPTVAQWRGQRLRSSTIDPVRTNPVALRPPPPLASLPAGDRAALVAGVDRQLAVVLNHVQPHPHEAHRALTALGVCSRDVVVTPGSEDAGWRVQLHRTNGLVERLVELQTADACTAEARLADVPTEQRR